MSTIRDTDLLLVNRGGTDYKVTLSDLDLYINPVPGFVTASVGAATSNWSPYIKVEDYDTGESKDIYLNDNGMWYYSTDRRNPDRIFDGDDDNVGLYACTERGKAWNPNVIFEPPEGISVRESLTIVAGFHGSSRLGTLAVNGVDVLEFDAWDMDPLPFTHKFTGSLDRFSIRQKNPRGSGGGPPYAPGISSIYLDDKQLLNRNATTLTFEPSEFFDRLKVGTRLMQLSPKVEGVVSAIDSDNLKVVLDDRYPEFVTGSSVIIVGEEL